MGKNWYVIKTQTSYEAKVRDNLLNAISANDLKDIVPEIIVPEFMEVVVKEGKETEKLKRLYPGYVLINAEMSEDVWFVIRNTMGVFGLLGSSGGGAKPVPLTDEEVADIMEKQNKRIYKNENVKVEDKIVITVGDLKGRDATVVSVDHETHRVTAELFNGMKVDLYFGEFK